MHFRLSPSNADRLLRLACALLVLAGSLGAQSPDPLVVGARVSITPTDDRCRSRWRPCTPESWSGGTLTRVTADTLVLQFGASHTIAIARNQRQRIFVSQGRSRTKSAVLNALSYGVITYMIADLTDASRRSTLRLTAAMAGGGVALGVLQPIERWRRVRE